MPSTTYAFNVILPQQEDTKLRELAEHLRSSRGATVRRLIISAHLMCISEVPTCADGQRCLAPQMHVRRPPSPAPAHQP